MDQAHTRIMARHIMRSAEEEISFTLPEEVPIAFFFNEINHSVSMASPVDLIDLAHGYALSEGIIDHIDEIRDAVLHTVPGGQEVRIIIDKKRMERLQLHLRKRAHRSRSGCGLCGVESIEDAVRPVKVLATVDWKTTADIILAAVASFSHHQPLRAMVGSVHGAAFANPNGEILLLREDIGRHNALDKLIGAAAKTDIKMDAGMLIMSSRCGFEIAQKAALTGISTIICVSAPSNEALRLAKRAHMTLATINRAQNGLIILNGGEHIRACP